MKCPAVAAPVLLAAAGPGAAHPDYEQPLTTLPGPLGDGYVVVLHSTDGIIGPDPVKLVGHHPQAGDETGEEDGQRAALLEEPLGRRHPGGSEEQEPAAGGEAGAGQLAADQEPQVVADDGRRGGDGHDGPEAEVAAAGVAGQVAGGQ